MTDKELLESIRADIARSFDDLEQGNVYSVEDVRRELTEDYNDAVKAIQESDGETISREEIPKRYGVSVEDLLDYEAGMKAREQFKRNPVTYSIDDVIKELEQEL